MITSIIFSKNRPLQLDLCLNSIKQNFPDTNEIVVLENYEHDYSKSLSRLKQDHQDVRFYKQSASIYSDIEHILKITQNRYSCFFTDDNIFYRYFTTNLYDNILNSDIPACCMSLRLGVNISKRSHLGVLSESYPSTSSVFTINEIPDVVMVSKTDNKYGTYWSYSHSVDGHIFKTSDLLGMMIELSFLDIRFHFKQTPNEVETQMQRYWALSHNFITFPKYSCVVNSPNNRVSDSHNENLSGEDYNYTTEALHELYLANKRIDINKLDFSSIECPHQEINLMDGIS